MTAFNHITYDPTILNGKECIRGMRLTVRKNSNPWRHTPKRDELRAEYPELEDEDIRQSRRSRGGASNGVKLLLDQGLPRRRLAMATDRASMPFASILVGCHWLRQCEAANQFSIL